MYRLIFSIVLLTSVVLGCSASGSDLATLKANGIHFGPLNQTEFLAYKITGNRQFTLYSVDSKGKVLRKIGSWDSVEEWGELQFTSDRKACVFSINDGSSQLVPVFFVNGSIGEVTYLGNYYLTYKLSSDGSQLLAEDRMGNKESSISNFLLVPTGASGNTKRVEWKIRRSAEATSFSLVRDGNDGFKILICTDGGLILAAAILESISATLTLQWDKLPDNKVDWRYDTDSGWHDEVANQYKNPLLKLK